MQVIQVQRRAAFSCLVFMTGCSAVKSGDIATSGIHADFSAISSGDGTTAQAILRAGDAQSTTYVNLEGGDELTATAEDETVSLTEVNLGELYAYVGALAAQEPGAVFTFAFNRTVEDSAPESTATMPESFLLTSPLADTVFSRAADPLTVTWDPSGSTDTMEVGLHSECIIDANISAEGDPGRSEEHTSELQSH